MPRPLFVAFSDAHLDVHAWADRPAIAGDSQHAFEQICDYAIEHQLPMVAAGDLIDRRINSAAPIGFLRRQLDRLRDAQIPFFFIQGQHELQPTPWLSEIHEWPIWLHDVYANIGGRVVYGLDWQPHDKVANCLDRVPEDCDALVLHQVCHEFMGSIAPAEISLVQVPWASLVVVGDYHVHRRISLAGKQGQSLSVLSPGSTHLRAINEESVKRFFVVYDDLSAQSVPLQTRPLIDRLVLSDDDLDDLVATIRDEILADTGPSESPVRKPIVRVRYSPDLRDPYRRICEAVGNTGHLFASVYADEKEGEWEEGDETFDEVSQLGLVGCLPALLPEEQDPQLFSFVRSLLEQDHLPVLAEWRARFLGEVDETA